MMNLTHWKPFGGLMGRHNRFDGFDRFFEDDFFKDFGFSTKAAKHWHPAADVIESDDDYIFKLDVPGIAKDEIDIQFHDNTLTVTGERKKEEEKKDENMHRVERFSGKFSRSFTLPKDTDGTHIDASLKDGILELRIPKAEEKKPRSIPITLN